jgi:hypothetical protein
MVGLLMAREGYVLIHPNRQSAAAKGTRLLAVALLLISAGLILLITIGGWSALEGTQFIQIVWAGLYILFAILTLQWRRGPLTLAAAMGVGMTIFAIISGPEWFSRDKPGFTSPTLDETFLGLLTYILIPVQLLMIAVCARGFTQGWNVEEEVPIDELPPEQRPRGEQAPATA